jgi:hypothetical protein
VTPITGQMSLARDLTRACSTDPRRAAVVTVATASYLPFVRVLAGSLAAHEPGLIFTAVVADAWPPPRSEPYAVLTLEEAAPRLAGALRTAYEPPALAMAAKASVMLRALDDGADTVVFLDPDMLVTDVLGPLLTVPGDIVLVPHLISPARGPSRAATELRLLQGGVFNGGVLRVSNSPTGRGFLEWWEDRLRHACRHDLPAGLHYDQRWLDLAPGLFGGVTVLCDPGTNVAYWNLHERPKPWRLFHFSGFDARRPELASRHAPDMRVQDLGGAAALFRAYAAAVCANGGGP